MRRRAGRRQNFSLHLPVASWEDSRASVGPDTQGCREAELLWVSASRAELAKVSREEKINQQISECVRGAERGVGAVMCCEWNLCDCRGRDKC